MVADVIETVQYRVWIRTEEAELGPEKLTVRTVQVVEVLSEPYRVTVELLTQDYALDIEGLLGARFELEIMRGEHLRRVPGVVVQTQYIGTSSHALAFELEASPALALLEHSFRSRVFQDMSVPDIVSAVAREAFEPLGRAIQIDFLQQSYPPRDYCTQHAESDLAFVLRILSEEGIAFAFDTAGDTETMVLVDDNAAYRPFDVDGFEGTGAPATAVPLVGTQQEEASTQSVQYLDRLRRVGTKTWRVSAWDWKSGSPSLLEQRLGSDEDEPLATFGEHRELTTRRLFEGERSDGPHLDDTHKRVGVLAQRAGQCTWSTRGVGNVVEFAAGSTFELTGHANTELDGGYLLTKVTLRGDCPDVEPGASGSAQPQYQNEFECQPLRVPFRPERIGRPRMHGPQMARVIGPGKDEIHCDALGRIRIRMLWDEDSPADASSCWVRVVQSWAGDGFGTMFIPRVGMEVLVTFLDGNPDRPVVTGCLYNGSNAPPWTLPEHQTRSGIRTRSTPEDDGHNELRFEDSAGHEQVYLHAQRNLDEVVRANQSTRVGGSRTLEIGKDRTTEIKGEEKTTIEGDRNEFLKSHHLEVVDGTHTLHVNGKPTEAGHRGAARFITGEYKLDVTEKITIKCGASLIELKPDGISIAAPAVSLAIAGAPAAAPTFGSAASLAGPQTKLDLLPDMLKMESTAVTADTGQSKLELHHGAALTTDTAVTVQSPKGYVRLDTDASIGGMNVNVEAELNATMKGTEARIEGTQTKIDGSAQVNVTGGRVHIDGGGGTADFQMGTVKIN